MDIDSLKMAMKKSGYTQAEVAKAIGMSVATFRKKLKNETLGLIDAEILSELLALDNPGKIFFDEK